MWTYQDWVCGRTNLEALPLPPFLCFSPGSSSFLLLLFFALLFLGSRASPCRLLLRCRGLSIWGSGAVILSRHDTRSLAVGFACSAVVVPSWSARGLWLPRCAERAHLYRKGDEPGTKTTFSFIYLFIFIFIVWGNLTTIIVYQRLFHKLHIF